MELLRTVSPIDGQVVVERPLATAAELDRVLDRGVQAARNWRNVALEDRIVACERLVDSVMARRSELAREITVQMGRPIRYAESELSGFEQRARAMISMAPQALADIQLEDSPKQVRFIRREPLGVNLVLAAWNYPYLIAVNTLIPSLLSGNVVVLKHSDQTPLCGERLAEAAKAAGLPGGLVQAVHMSHALTAEIVADNRVEFVAFTGSVQGGRAVHAAAGGHLKAVGLELGGKDPAYVRSDAALEATVENLVDGAFFNSGQSCCGIERIYVEKSLFGAFTEAFVAKTKAYVLGNPLLQETTLGPVVRTSNAASIQAHVDQAIGAGARGLVSSSDFEMAQPHGPYLAPQVLVDVDHSMEVMREETFGPVVGIMPVSSDDEALSLMNDSKYGLTASIWTQDAEVALRLGQRIHTGTVFMNRCDVLDPELAWVGVKQSGRGCTLSRVGFEHLTRPKSFHFRMDAS